MFGTGLAKKPVFNNVIMSGMNTLQANICLMCVTFCWSTEVIIFACIPDSVPPFATTCLTSLAGAVLLLLSFYKRIHEAVLKDRGRLIKRCVLLGVLNCTYNVLYLYGLKYFDVSSGAFTLSMTAVVLPVILFTLKKKVSVRTWISAGLVFLGILLAVGNNANIGQIYGALMIGGGCIIRAVFIVILNRYACEDDPVAISAFISGMVGIISAALWLVTDPSGFGSLPWTKEILSSLIIYSYFIVAFAQTLNIFAQKKSTPANATIIYSLEIMFSVIWGLILPSSIVDRVVLTPWIVIGVILVVLGNIVEIIPIGKEKAGET